MILASGDPLNFILATVWSAVLLFCLWLTWYAYARWKRNPDGSLSQLISARVQRARAAALVAGGIGIGFSLGMFVGHFCWPVEVVQ